MKPARGARRKMFDLDPQRPSRYAKFQMNLILKKLILKKLILKKSRPRSGWPGRRITYYLCLNFKENQRDPHIQAGQAETLS